MSTSSYTRWRGTKVYASVLALVALPFIGMGGYLLSLGGSAYFVLAGFVLVSCSVLLWRGSRAAPVVYALLIVATLMWSFWEVGANGWGLVSRLAAYLVLGLPMLWIFLRTGRRRLFGFAGLALATMVLLAYSLASPVAPPEPFSGFTGPVAQRDWAFVGGTPHGTRYAPYAEVNTSNVAKLEVAWTYRAGAPISEATPLKIGDALYFCTQDNILISLDAESGTQRWRHDPNLAADRPAKFCRGVAYHEQEDAPKGSVCKARILTSTRDARLIAVDAATGLPCPDFGGGGTVDLRENMGEDQYGYQYSTSPPIVVGRVAIVGTGIYDGQSTDEPSGVGGGARTGALAWAWDIGRPGVNTAPPPGQTYVRGTPNVWSLTSADPELGLVYLPTGNAPPDYFGAHRTPEMEKFTSSVVALDATDGSVRWHFQTTHHDVWDYDVASQPVLIDFPTPSGPIPALLQPTKHGELFVLDRRTGRPLTRVEERPVPQGAVKGDFTSPTQPFSIGMPRLRPVDLREADMWGVTPLDQLWCRIKFKEARYEGRFTPPGLKTVVQYPSNFGVSNWGSVSVDEKAGIVLAPTVDMATYIRLIPRESAEARRFDRRQTSGFPEIQPENGAPQAGTPYAVTNQPFMSPLFVPCTRPPYGRLTAIDLKSRRILWQRPIGTTYNSGPLRHALRLPLPMGVPLVGGVLVTGGNLSFFAGSQDGHIRALSTRTGKELWRARLPRGSDATPITYLGPRSGRQTIVVTAGAPIALLPKDDYVVAYRLPVERR
jgi:membrane-bound PQQ-dependent dehydrogenase (glucose/quinate/shikimate family)